MKFRGKTSAGTKSEITGMIEHVNSLVNSLCNDWMTIQITLLVIVLVELIPQIGIVYAVMGSFKRLAKPSEMKLAVAHVSNNARQLT